MRIAVTYENEQVFQHFGHTEQFKIYETLENNLIDSKIVSTNGQGHESLAGFLKNHNVETLICGGIGGGAINALTEAGIKYYGGVTGNADQAVKAFLEGHLEYNPDVRCSHHDHEEGHDCSSGEHSCGSDGHSCGDKSTDLKNQKFTLVK